MNQMCATKKAILFGFLNEDKIQHASMKPVRNPNSLLSKQN